MYNFWLYLAIPGVCTLVGLVLFHTELDERAKERGSPIPYTATVYSTGAAVAVVGGVFSCILARQPSAATTDQQPPIQYHDGLYNPGFLASSAVPPAADLYSGPSQHQGEFHQPDVYQNGRAGLPTPSHPMNLQQYVYLEPPESQGYVTNRDGQEDRIPNNETYAVTTRNLAPASGYYQESANPEKVPRDQRESETGYRETHAGSQGQGERQGPYPERGERYEYYGLEEGHTGAGRDGRKVGQYDVNAAGDVAVSSPIWAFTYIFELEGSNWAHNENVQLEPVQERMLVCWLTTCTNRTTFCFRFLFGRCCLGSTG